MNEEAKRLGNLLLENGLITQEQLEHVLKTQKFTGKNRRNIHRRGNFK